jgi:hypothetical protein
MTRANVTIAVLAILILVLCVLSYAGKPLITGQYVPAIGTLTRDIGRTNIGHKLLINYVSQLQFFVYVGAEPYKGLTEKDTEKIDTFLITCLFAGLVVVVGFFVSVALFVINSGQQPPISKSKMVVTVVMVILAGTIIRLILAAAVYGNFDMRSYETVADIAGKGGNVYAETQRYNYSPVWFLTLYALKQIQLALPGMSFHFAVKSFICVVDLLTLVVLLLIARIRKLPPVTTAIFFYLNPVSFLVTGYHGQFENFAMLMVLIGIFLYLWLANRPVLGTALLWLFATAGMIIKHNTFYELIICLHSSIKRYWIKMLLFVVSVVIFFLLFIPYWEAGSKGIIENVFKYGSGFGAYGLTWLFKFPWLKNLFILAMFIFPLFLKSKDIIAQCLLGTLFFLTFTTGIATQYFVLPIALGALRPSRFLLFYTILATLFIFGNANNVFIPGFQIFRWNVVWVGAACWFIAEMRLDRREARSTH